jgi:prolyl oligopeptidase
MIDYPAAPKSDQVDDYHGTPVADPFRTLENADDVITRDWVERQNALSGSILARAEGRERVRRRLTELWNYERFSDFSKAGGRYFYFHNSGLQNQAVLYVMDALDGQPRVLIDPNTYRADGTAALNGESLSEDGRLMAYAIAQAGSDWNEWRVRDVETGEDLPDLVRWSKTGAPAWAPDNSGFYYARFQEPAPEEFLTAISLHEKIYFHRLGDDQDSDRLIYERPDHPNWLLTPMVMEETSILVVSIQTGTWGINLLAWRDTADPSGVWNDLITTETHSYEPFALLGWQLYLRTNDEAPRGRVIAVDLKNPDRAGWREITKEREETLESAQMAGGRILLTYMKDARSAARLATMEGEAICEVELPDLGTARWSLAHLHDGEVFYSFTSFTRPAGIFRLDMGTGASSPVRAGNCPFDASAYETRQVFFESKDGTRVPMFISARKGLTLDGSNPAVLYGYGGFDVPLTPGFAPYIAAWMERGGVWAVANLRGGSEYGEAWHQAGMRERKQNVFDDFIAAAEALIAMGYTRSEKLAIFGGSNGGLLVGAVLNQRPELFGAAMPAVGVMDMLRFHRFGFGAQWTGEYGTPDDAVDFPRLHGYSPLHNIRPGKYPAVLITTADHDDRVMPGHSLKYAAALQEAQRGTAPILLRVDTRAGHGAGKPLAKVIDEWTDRFSFLDLALELQDVAETV